MISRKIEIIMFLTVVKDSRVECGGIGVLPSSMRVLCDWEGGVMMDRNPVFQKKSHF